MNLDRLYEILDATTQMLRKGDEIVTEKITAPTLVEDDQGAPVAVGERTVMEVRHVYAMPHESEVGERDDVTMVDCHFITVGVLTSAAEACRADLVEILSDYPEPMRLAGGPSYIEIGAVVGSQDGALRLFALGKALGLWDIVTPERLGFSGPEADRMAGMGYVMMTGYTPDGVVDS